MSLLLSGSYFLNVADHEHAQLINSSLDGFGVWVNKLTRMSIQAIHFAQAPRKENPTEPRSLSLKYSFGPLVNACQAVIE